MWPSPAPPDKTFLLTPAGNRYTYGDMQDLSGRLAAALASRGVMPSDRVLVQVDKSPQAVALYLACLQLGAVIVPLNTAYTLAELEYFIGDAQPRVAVLKPETLPHIATIAASKGVAHLESLDADGAGSLTELAARVACTDFPKYSTDSDALAALLYTSGTTGRSKGAMLTRGNLLSNAATLADAWKFSAQDVLLHVLPIFHVHGLFVAINTVLVCGGSMLFAEKFEPQQAIRLLSQATVMMGVPTHYTRLLQQPELTRDAVRSMRLFISGSAPLLAKTHREFAERTGHAILERYGMSETLMNTSNPYDGERIAGTVGPPLPGVELRICDPETRTPLSVQGQVGTIQVRGPNVFRGYWRMPDKTAAELLPDGFFVTGDLGIIDARGYVHIVGRGKDLIITGGYNVYPVEVEAEIDALPGVQESAVIGVPHADFGEGVTAIVVAESGVTLEESTVRSALQQRLANFKLPKRVLFVAALPRNTMGKVQKSVLRESYADLYHERCDS